MTKDKIKEIERKYDMWADDYNLEPQDVEWLIEQTELGISQQEQFHDYQTQNLRLQERVRELEHKIYQDHRQEVLEGLYERNKRYREALEFYADERNYEERDFGIIKQNAIQEGDKGNTARQALEDGK